MNKNFGDIQSRLESLKQDVIDKHLQGFENLKDQYDKVKEVGEQGMAAFGLMKSSAGIKKLVGEFRKRAKGTEGTGENTKAEAGDVEAENIQDIEDAFIGEFGTFRDFADEMADEHIQSFNKEIQQFVFSYFDYEKYARDLEHDFHVITLDNYKVAIFDQY